MVIRKAEGGARVIEGDLRKGGVNSVEEKVQLSGSLQAPVFQTATFSAVASDSFHAMQTSSMLFFSILL